jgi:drug/metabolite transporter (DMT)-like permease
VVLLGERPSGLQLLGVGCVLAGLVSIAAGRRRAAAPA